MLNSTSSVRTRLSRNGLRILRNYRFTKLRHYFTHSHQQSVFLLKFVHPVASPISISGWYSDSATASMYPILTNTDKALLPIAVRFFNVNIMLQNSGIEVYVIGVGHHISNHDLEVLASEPKDKHVFHVRNFQSIQSIHVTLEDDICGKYCTSTTLVCLFLTYLLFIVNSFSLTA